MDQYLPILSNNYNGKFNILNDFLSVKQGSDTYLLEDELNEMQWIQNNSRMQFTNLMLDNGFVTKQTQVLDTNSSIDQTLYVKSYGNTDMTPNTLLYSIVNYIPININGYILKLSGSYRKTVTGGNVPNNNLLIQLPDLPSSGTVVNFVFLEAWIDELSGLNTINAFGGENNASVTNNIIDTRINAETSRRIQLRWRVRVENDININQYSQGLDCGTIYAKGKGNLLSVLPFKPATDSSFNGLFLNTKNLFVAKGDANLSTDGLVYAIPLFAIKRTAGVPNIQVSDVTDLRPNAFAKIAPFTNSPDGSKTTFNQNVQVGSLTLDTSGKIITSTNEVDITKPDGTYAKLVVQDLDVRGNFTNAQIYTTINTAIQKVIGAAPTTLDTLNELATALADDPNFATTMTNQLALKADKTSIPTTLPANGGNSDTVDGKHAADLAPISHVSVIGSSSIGHVKNGGNVVIDTNGNMNVTLPTTLPANGGNADTVDGCHASDLTSISHVSVIGGSSIGHVKNGGNVVIDTSGNMNVTLPTTLPANGGNADTVDGQHASAFAPTGHQSIIGGSSIGHVKNGGNVVIDTSGNMNVTLPTIPTSLPANGGNADTVDGKHASDLAPSGYGLGTMSTDISSKNLNDYQTTGFFRGSAVTNAPNSGWFWFIIQAHDGGSWTNQIAASFGASNTANIMYMRTNVQGTWSGWSQIAKITDMPTSLPANGGNSDTVDGCHAGNAANNVAINNGTINTNLNADMLDGLNAGNANGNVAVNNGTVNNNLNADMLDGNHSTAFAPASHTHSAGQVSGLATVATTGSYNDLSNKPSLATVATTGSYNDLSNKPTIPTIPSSLPANGGNSDTVDNLHGTQFLRNDTNGTLSGNLNVTGTITGSVVYNAVYNDYAEFFLRDKDDKLEPGDVVIRDPKYKMYVKSSVACDRKVVGVYSDSFGHIVGGDEDKTIEENMERYVPIGLSGRVFVKVTGDIAPGDLLVTSDIPGVATNSKDYMPGTVIGKALDEHTGDSIDRIEMLIMNI